MIQFVQAQAELSKCKDKKTAAALVSADMTQVYSIGINGGPKGGRDCICDTTSRKVKYSCIHAEMNCLVKNRVIDDTPKIMICTKQPCHICASLIVNSCTNIKEVWYSEEYWDKAGIDILHDAGIRVWHIAKEEVE